MCRHQIRQGREETMIDNRLLSLSREGTAAQWYQNDCLDENNYLSGFTKVTLGFCTIIIIIQTAKATLDAPFDKERSG